MFDKKNNEKKKNIKPSKKKMKMEIQASKWEYNEIIEFFFKIT